MSTLETLAALGKVRKVHVFECAGITLTFRGLSNAERIEYRDYATAEATASGSDNYLIAKALCKADGTSLFDSAEDFHQAVQVISTWDPVEVCKPLIDRILIASGIGKAAEETAAKN